MRTSGKNSVDEDTMRSVPFDMYRSRKSVHPGACAAIAVCGREESAVGGPAKGSAGIFFSAGAEGVGKAASRRADEADLVGTSGSLRWVPITKAWSEAGPKKKDQTCMDAAPRRMRNASRRESARRTIGSYQVSSAVISSKLSTGTVALVTVTSYKLHRVDISSLDSGM